MGLWRDFFEGFAEGVLTTAAFRGQARSNSNGSCGRGRIDRLCYEIGWAVDERNGGVVRLHFNNPGGGVRKVQIAFGDEELVAFSAYSFAVIPAADVAPDLLGYLLTRNGSDCAIGKWGVYVADEENVLFCISYQALGSGLDAPTLKFICESQSTRRRSSTASCARPGCCARTGYAIHEGVKPEDLPAEAKVKFDAHGH